MSSSDPSRLAADIIQRLGTDDLDRFLAAHRGDLSPQVIAHLQEQAGVAIEAHEYAAAIAFFDASARIASLLPDSASMRVALLESICALHKENGDAAGMLKSGLSARQAAFEGLTEVLGAAQSFVRISITLAQHADHDHAFARRLLAETRAACVQHGLPTGVLWSEMALAEVCLKMDDSARARDYAAAVQHHFTLLDRTVEHSPPVPTAEQVASTLLEVASHFYYKKEDFETAAAVAKMIVEVAPEVHAGHTILAYSLGRLERFDEADRVWETVLTLRPDDASTYANYAGVKSARGQLDDAIPLVTKAIALAPDNIKYRKYRAQVYTGVGQYDAAIADYRAVIAMCAAQPAPAPDTAGPRQSKLDYERNMPLADVADFARAGVVEVLIRAGRSEEALREAGSMIETGDDATRYAGFMMKQRVLRAEEHIDAAIEAASGALAALPNATEALRARAELLLAAGRAKEALTDLAELAGRDHDPNAAAEMLTTVLGAEPDNALALKWRGFAWFEQWRPSKAAPDFERAIALLPQDPQVHLWHGLTQILFSAVDPDEEAYSNRLGGQRLLAAIKSIGTAAHLNPVGQESIGAYKWLVDRVTADPVFIELLTANGEQPNGLFSLIPESRLALEHHFRSFALARQRRWAEAITELKSAQVLLRAAGLPVFAARLDLHLADNYLRLYQLQDVLDCLDRLDKLDIANARPLSAVLEGKAQEFVESAQKQGSDAAIIELDYMGVYTIGLEEMGRAKRLMRSSVLARLGDHDAALEALGDIDDFFDKGGTSLKRDISFQALLTAAMIVRDAGDRQGALDLLTRIEPFAGTPRDKAALHNTQGLIHSLLDQLDEAARCFTAAREEVADDPSQTLVIDANLAQNHLHRGDPAGAMRVLDGVDIERQARSKNDRLGYHQVRAIVLLRLERYDEAGAASETAITIAESMREEVQFLETRMSLLEKFREIYEIAIRIALLNGESAKAFDLVERSKARAFLDQLAASDLPVPEEGKQVEAVLERLRAKERLLSDLLSAATDDPGVVDLEAVAQLQALDARATVLEEGIPPKLSAQKITEELSSLRKNLERRVREFEQIKVKHWDQKAGAVLSVAEVHDLLAGEAT